MDTKKILTNDEEYENTIILDNIFRLEKKLDFTKDEYRKNLLNYYELDKIGDDLSHVYLQANAKLESNIIQIKEKIKRLKDEIKR